jgi:hypothetical protein
MMFIDENVYPCGRGKTCNLLNRAAHYIFIVRQITPKINPYFITKC